MTKMTMAAIACLCIPFLPRNAYGDEWNKKTIFTFNAPVEVPGQVLLPGSYVFKLLDTQADRHIVQVFNKDQNHLIGTFLTIPDYRMKPSDKPLLTFEERAAGAPEAIKSWFYPGDSYGNEFVYPKKRATEIAAQSQQNVPSMPSSMSSNTTSAPENQNSQQVSEMKQADIKAEKPSGEEVQVANIFLVVAPVTPEPPEPAPVSRTLVALVRDEPAPAMHSARSELPTTASPIPGLLLFGSTWLAAGLTLRKRARRVN
jgi:hypothetical protein